MACVVCGMTFHDRRDLDKHLLQMHGIIDAY